LILAEWRIYTCRVGGVAGAWVHGHGVALGIFCKVILKYTNL
jgi:hypothetical protein